MQGRDLERSRGRDRAGSGRSTLREVENVIDQGEEEFSTPSLRTPAASSPSLVYECLFKTEGSVDSVLAEGLGVDFACQAGLLPISMDAGRQLDRRVGVVPQRGGKRSGGSDVVSSWEEEQDSSCAQSGGGFRPIRAWHSAGGEGTQKFRQVTRYRGRQRRLFEEGRGRSDRHQGGDFAQAKHGEQAHVVRPLAHPNTQGSGEAVQETNTFREVRFTGGGFRSNGETADRGNAVPATGVPPDNLEGERRMLEQQARARQSWEGYRRIEADWQEFLKKQAGNDAAKATVEVGNPQVFPNNAERMFQSRERRRDGETVDIRGDFREGPVNAGGGSHRDGERRPPALTQHHQQWQQEQRQWREQVEAMEGRNWAREQDTHQKAPLPNNQAGEVRRDEVLWTDPEENLFARDTRMQAWERTEAQNHYDRGGGWQNKGTGELEWRHGRGIPQYDIPAVQEPWRERGPFPGRNVEERMTGWNPAAEAEMYRRRGMAVPPELCQERNVYPKFPHMAERREETERRWTQEGNQFNNFGNAPVNEVIPAGVVGAREGGLSRVVTSGSPQVWTWGSTSPGVGIVSAIPAPQSGTGGRWDTKVVPIEWPRAAGGPPPMDRINMKLPVFTGSKQPTLPEDAEQWLNTLGAAVGNNMWTFDQAFKMIQSHLQGPAGTWYGSYGGFFRMHPEGRYAGWHTFWVEFEARFVVRDESQLEAALQNRVQRTNESIMDFADSLRVLASKLGINCDSRRVRMLFLNGLHNQQLRHGIMTHAVVRMTTESLRATVSMALEYEDFLATEKLAMKQMKQGSKEGSPKVEIGKDNRLAKQVAESAEVEAENATWKQAFHKQAKQIEELFKRQTGLSQTIAKTAQQSAAPVRKPLSEIQCNNCKEMGHFARNCPHPRREYKPAAKTVRFLEEDLDQIRLAEEVDPGWYPLDSICGGQEPTVEDELAIEDDVEWEGVCTLGVGLAPDAGSTRLNRCGEVTRSSVVRNKAVGLDPRNTWVQISADGRITNTYIAHDKEAVSAVGQQLAKLSSNGRTGDKGDKSQVRKAVPPASRPSQSTAAAPEPGLRTSAYDPTAPPLPGIVYQPCYTAYLPAKILGTGVSCLLDTGATISVLTVATVLKLRLQAAVQKTNKCFYTASAQCVPAYGELPQLPVEVDGVCIPVNFYIVPKGGYELLIGMDFLVPRCAVLDMGRATLSFAKKVVPGDDYAVMKKVNIDIRQSKASPLSFLRNCTVDETEEWRAFPPEEEWEEIVGARNTIWNSDVFVQQASAVQCSIMPDNRPASEESTPDQLFGTIFQSAPLTFAVSGHPELPPASVDQLLVCTETGRSRRPNIAPVEGAEQEEPKGEGATFQKFAADMPRLEEPFLKTGEPRMEELAGVKVNESKTMTGIKELDEEDGIYMTCESHFEGLDFLADRVWERVTGRNGLGGLVQGEYVASGSEFVESVAGDRGADRVSVARDPGRLTGSRGLGCLEEVAGIPLGMREVRQKGRRSWTEGMDDSVEFEISESKEEEELEISKGQAGELGAEALAAALAAANSRAAVQESLSSGKERQLAEKKVVSSWPESLDEGIAEDGVKDESKRKKKLMRQKSALEQIIDMSAKEWKEECKRSGALPGKFSVPAITRKNLNVKKQVETRAAWKPTMCWALEMEIKEWIEEYEREEELPGKFSFPAINTGTRDDLKEPVSVPKMHVWDPGLTEGKGSLDQYEVATPEGEDEYLDSNCFTFCAVYSAKVEKHFPDNIPVGEHLTAAQRKEVRELVMEFTEVFEEDPFQLTCSTLEPHVIETGEARPIHIPPYRYSQKESDAIEAEVSKMLQLGIIEPSTSPWSASVVAVIKKDLTLRICVDFRELNKVTKSDNYPIPLIEDMLDRLAGSDCFSSLDLRSAFWQVVMKDCSKEKTAFSTKTGHYQFKRMPFGLKNAVPTFQRGVDLKFKQLQKNCQQYVDDLTAHGKGFKAGMDSLRAVLVICREAVLKVKAAKTTLIMLSIDYLGFVVSGAGVKPDPKRVEAILKLQVPTDVTGIRAAIGMYIQYKRYMPEFSREAAVLNDLVKKGREWKWNEECDLAWQKLKKLLTSAPLLAHPNLQMTMVIQSDWSPRALGAVLSQRQYTRSGEVAREEVVAYYSKKLNDAEQNYSATEGECLAVVKAIANWHKYLFGRRFVVETDHLALRWLMQARNLDGRVARWSVKLMPYEFTTVYRRGSKNLAADAMSRLRHVSVQEFITFCTTAECLQEVPVTADLCARLDGLPAIDVEARMMETLQKNCWNEDEFRSEPETWLIYMQKTEEWCGEGSNKGSLFHWELARYSGPLFGVPPPFF